MNRLKELFLALLLACLLGGKALATGFEYVRVDGRSPNPEVIIKNRNPVITWKISGDTGEDARDVCVNVSTQASFGILHSSFTTTVEENVFRVTYSSTALAENTTYYLRMMVNISSGWTAWSEAEGVMFFTVLPQIEINDSTVDLKVDWNNPFYSGEVTKIRYSIPRIDQKVFLSIYSPSGRLVKVLVDNEVKIFDVIHTEYWDGKDESNSMVGSGIYLVNLRVGDNYKTVKVCFIR